MIGAVRYTLRWLAERGLPGAPFDKESGVCLIRRAGLQSVKLGVLRRCYGGFGGVAAELPAAMLQACEVGGANGAVRPHRPHREEVDELQ